MAPRIQLPATMERRRKRLDQIIVTLKALDWFERHRCLGIIERSNRFYWWHYCRMHLSPDEYVEGKATGQRAKRVVKLSHSHAMRQRKITEFFAPIPRPL